MSQTARLKIVLLGEGAVGKSSLLLRYVEDKFNSKHLSTLQVKNWVKELKRMLGEAVCIIIAGNKLDLEANRNVNKEVVEEYADSVGAQFQECSAKENLGVNPLFDMLTTAMLEKAGQDAVNEDNQRSSSLRRRGSRRSLQIVDDTLEQSAPKKKCC